MMGRPIVALHLGIMALLIAAGAEVPDSASNNVKLTLRSLAEGEHAAVCGLQSSSASRAWHDATKGRGNSYDPPCEAPILDVTTRDS